MKYNSYGEFTVRGELGARCALLSSRLESPIYRPDVIFSIEPGGWPGDWEGRTILALTAQSQATHREPSYLDEIVQGVANACNNRGYLGKILDGQLDEQQLSGHSWLLRGLCEYYLYRREKYVLELIDGIIKGLFLPALGLYNEYPIRPEQRVYRGAEAGESAGLVGSWYISTDTGCAYIPLDGVTHAYEILHTYAPEQKRDSKLSALIDEMVYNFMKIPFVEICVQTHATLTGLRGLIRRYGQKPEKEYLTFAERIFALYKAEGMTANYANFNWFGRPEWTEPCAIIDSFMVASQLYELTEKAEYAEDAQLILCNGIFHAQRPNGGFGCDSCAVDGTLRTHCYEAYWCCTMRGGEGLAKASQYALCGDKILYPASGDYTVDGKTLKIQSPWPHGGKIKIKYDGEIKLFIPRWATDVKCDVPMTRENNFVKLNLSGTTDFTEIELIYADSTDTYKGKTRRFRGAMLMGVRADGKETFLDTTYLLTPDEVNSLQIKLF